MRNCPLPERVGGKNQTRMKNQEKVKTKGRIKTEIAALAVKKASMEHAVYTADDRRILQAKIDVLRWVIGQIDNHE